ncbi:TPA: ketoacyl-ACP synthase III [Campylobacter jejuni]|uniref:ketoacyl-ACP synthase III n=1 Tax=Campylobacter jejuni TaxID=197 RepID=UPI000F815E9F|nr:ketoacyl-ACP synthase III [Campylobacter jejuni]EFP2985278.1 ketoacyl-ACP synthase III [Campylobacter jejuni]RTJ66524.1 3-ketoacyl-ACP synthase [Campylobacter jejuni]HDZ4294089.1 ketoacyl-ACP synthase III [Campylobacter jejuni]HEC1683302.1 ketoacyl-ACP synthase III [Campylobacter jejuni]HEC2322770.1 ketoacyl-ACP synthase III [Campylobacter jejuni]
MIRLNNAKISHICGILPSKKIDNFDNIHFNDKEKQKIINTSGIRNRYVLNREQGETMLDLYKQAAFRVLNDLKWAKEEISGIIVISQNHEFRMPITAALLQNELGISKECFAYDVVLGCSAYAYGLFLAMNHICKECGKILLFVGDPVNDFIYPKNKQSALLFSDGGSCTAIEYCQGEEASFIFETDGSGSDMIMVSDGGSRNPINIHSFEEHQEGGSVNIKACMSMKGLEVFNFVCTNIPNSIDKILQLNSLKIDDISKFYLHQANYYALVQIKRKLNIKDEQFVSNINKYGNCGGTSLAILLSEEKLNFKNVILSGFGVGLSICTIYFKKIQCKSALLFSKI